MRNTTQDMEERMNKVFALLSPIDKECINRVGPHEWCGWCEITPPIAQKMLELHTNNRKISNAHVNRIATDIKENNWVRMPMPLIFTDTGTGVDGQHRLRAIVEANIAVNSLVYIGADEKECMWLDALGKRRMVHDQLGMHSEDPNVRENITGAHFTISFLLMRISKESRENALFGGSRFSMLEGAAFTEKHFEAIDFAISFKKNVAKGINAPAFAPLARAYYSVPRDVLSRFGEVLATGLSTSPSEHGIVKLRNRLKDKVPIRVNGVTRQPNREDTYKLVQSILRKYVDGRSIDRVKAVNIDLFPW